SPDALNFDESEIGVDAQPKEITLHNGGSSSFTVAGLVILPATDKPEFNLAAENCSETPILAGSDCRVTVSFTPARAGPQSAKLRVISATGVTYNIGLSGVGRMPEPTGYCCKDGVVGKAKRNDCQTGGGLFSENYDEVLKQCQAKPTPTPVVSPTPLEGYCCKDGNISKANSSECKSAGGYFSQNLDEVRQQCKPVSTPTPIPTITRVTP